MGKYAKLLSCLMVLILVLNISDSFAQQSGRIYGKVSTRDGETYEGRLSWGTHETVWASTFDADYNLYEYNRRAAERIGSRRRSSSNSRKIRFNTYFGNIVSIERDGNKAVVILKDGREFVMSAGDVSEPVNVSDKEFGKVKVNWKDVEIVEFMDEPAEYSRMADENASPIFGTVLVRGNMKFSGFIMWDNDETLSSHILSGNDGRRERSIAIGKIKSIEPISRNKSELTLWTGRTIELGGSNDVNSENRGIFISDKDFGYIKVVWRDFDRVDFKQKVTGLRYSDFKRAKPIHGTLVDNRGKEFTGFIRWDDDVSHDCDFLSGFYRDIDMKIAFSNIVEIRRRTRTSALVVLKNGTELLLRNSTDVSSKNKGIILLSNADDEDGDVFYWDDFEKIVFNK